MVVFLPFPGYRPFIKDGENIEDRVSPPYDVISDEGLEMFRSKKGNVTLLTFASDTNNEYKESKSKFESLINDGSLIRDSESFYIYEQTFDDRGVIKTRTGYVGKLKIEKYEEGHVIPCEGTFSKTKVDHLDLLRKIETHVESIFAIFDGFSKLLRTDIRNSAEKLYEFTDGTGVAHKCYKISSVEVIENITKELKNQKILIADGRHRYEAALDYSLENPNDALKSYVLATLVSLNDEGLSVLPVHRLIRANEIGENTAIKKICKSVSVKEVSRNELISDLRNYHFGMMFQSGKCILARYNQKSDDPIWNLDTYVVQEVIINGVYKADDGKSTVSYDSDVNSVIKKMDAKEYDVAVILNYQNLELIWDLVLIGKKMPKKTVFFFPKIWSGFVFYKMY